MVSTARAAAGIFQWRAPTGRLAAAVIIGGTFGGVSIVSSILYLERLSGADLRLLAEAAGEPGSLGERIERLRADPGRIEALLAQPQTFDALFSSGRHDPFVLTTPFLLFAVTLARAGCDLAQVGFVSEWAGSRRRIPVFDVAELREFLGDPLRRLFLADLLTSYTHVASGSVWVRTSRGLRRRRFSEMDPVALAQLAQEASGEDRLALYRRMGDLALFLTGVFPDHTGRGLFSPVALARVQRALGDPPSASGTWESRRGQDLASGEGVLLEWIGRRSYRLAWQATEPRDVGLSRVLGEVAERFPHARRILNFLTERYLFRRRDNWFRQL